MNPLKWLLSKRPKAPEALFAVEITSADEILCRPPGAPEQCIRIADLGSVYVETNDSGPWGLDVWWLLLDKSHNVNDLAIPATNARSGAAGQPFARAGLQSRRGPKVNSARP